MHYHVRRDKDFPEQCNLINNSTLIYRCIECREKQNEKKNKIFITYMTI